MSSYLLVANWELWWGPCSWERLAGTREDTHSRAHQGGRRMSGLCEASPSASSPVPQFPCPAQAASTRGTSIRARRPSHSTRAAAVFAAPARYGLAVLEAQICLLLEGLSPSLHPRPARSPVRNRTAQQPPVPCPILAPRCAQVCVCGGEQLQRGAASGGWRWRVIPLQ